MELSSQPLAAQHSGPAARTRPHAFTPVRQAALIAALVLSDGLTLVAVFVLAYLLRFANPFLLYYGPTTTLHFYSSLVFLAIPLWLLVFALHGLYDADILFGGTLEYARVAQACSIGTLVLILYAFVDRETQLDLSRIWLVFVWLLAIALVIVERFLLRRLVYGLRTRGHLRRRVLIVGANPEGRAVAGQLSDAPTAGLDVVGFVGRRTTDQAAGAALRSSPDASAAANDPSEQRAQRQPDDGVPILGSVDGLGEVVSRYAVDEIIIVPTAISRTQLLEIYEEFGLSDDVRVRLTPGLFEMLTTGARVSEAGYIPLVSLNRLRITGSDAWTKAVLDYGLILLSLPLLAVVFLAISILIRLDSPGPILHRRRVLGAGGRRFDAYKFRTMVVNADEVLARLLAEDAALREEYGHNHKLANDPRVTRLGHILRRTSLDELPQLINVLRGQMSLVGPRMIAEDEVERFGHWSVNLLTVKPGITGPWQVRGRNELPYGERVRLSMHYIRNYSIWTDLQILYQTIGAVVKGTGAF